jgi:multiple sugar transport system ATP-binding protein
VAASVSLKGVAKSFGPVKVVDGIDLEIGSGEFVVLVGPSGCGKSTTLRMVAGLEQATGGTITIGSKVVNHLAPKDRGVAMVFQNYALYPHLTVRNNISFGLRLGRMKADAIEAEVQRAAGILELQALLDRQPAELSGGQRQRVAMGRAIVRNPDVFLFDEPLSNLDAKLRTQMRAEIKRLHARLGTTVIYVTHDQLEAMTLADRIVVMRSGVIEQMGTPRELFNAPASAFVAGFIGSPPMNLMPCKVGSEGGQAVVRFGQVDGQGAGQSSALRLPPEAQAAVAGSSELLFGVRPDDLHLEARSGTEPIQGQVELVEPLGAESLVHVRVGSELIIMRAEGRRLFESDRPITLHADLQRIYLFDRASDRRVYHDAQAAL